MPPETVRLTRLIVPLWFIYDEGGLWCACHRNSYLIKHLNRLMRNGAQQWPCAFDISTNEIPYKGLAGTGYVTLHTEQGADRLQSLLDRYVADKETPFSKWLLERAPEEVALRITPETVRHWDFTARMTDTDG